MLRENISYLRKTFYFSFIMVIILILHSGCAGPVMTQTTVIKKINPDYALITFFIKPSGAKTIFRFDIWDGKNFIGTLPDGAFIQYYANPGQHLFMASYTNWDYLKAKLRKGKKYYVLLRPIRKNKQWMVSFNPIKKGHDIDQDKIDKWISRLQPLGLDETKKETYLKNRFSRAEIAFSEFNSQNLSHKKLEDDDYRPVDDKSYSIRLRNPKLPEVTTRDGDLASVEFVSTNTVEKESILLAIKYEVKQNYVTSVTHLIKSGDKPHLGTKFIAPTFYMSPNKSETIKFFIANPEIQGPSSGRVGFADYKKGKAFWLHGKKKVTLFIINCVDNNCKNKEIISNKIEAHTSFKWF